MLTADELQERLGYQFQDSGLLARALTHASSKDPHNPSNERLEFLGDAVLGLVVAHFLFSAFPGEDEGGLTRLRSTIVSTSALERFGRELGLHEAVRVGKGLQGRKLSGSVVADAVEAVIGAAFLDGGLDAVQPLILWGLAGVIEDSLAQRNERNWKSLLQEHTQQSQRVTPTYQVIEESGPDHRKEFVVAALVDGIERGRGRGPSKKIAEQAAAQQALRAVRG